MLKIGLTGGIGCGKTTVSNLFAEYNQGQSKDIVAIIDTDVISRQVAQVGEPAYLKIREQFGDDILNEDDSINRAALRDLIFNEPNLRLILNNIMHPAIQKKVQSEIDLLDAKYCIIVIPLLFETKSDYNLDRILVVDCNEDIQISRTVKRDRVSENDVRLILQAQASRQQRLELADDIITNNDDDLNLLREQVRNIHKLYLNIEK